MKQLGIATFSLSRIVTLMALASVAQAQAAPSPTPSPTSKSPSLAILGQVASPGTFQFQPVKLGVLIEAAGGLAKDADPSKIVVRRGMLLDPMRSASVSFNYALVQKGKAADLELAPGDVVEVPKRGKRSLLGKLDSAVRWVGDKLNAAAKPLLAAVTPALSALAERAGLVRVEGSPTPIGAPHAPPTGRTSRSLENAMLRAILAESPEVRERLAKQIQAVLDAEAKLGTDPARPKL